jgi:hypothetical protein
MSICTCTVSEDPVGTAPLGAQKRVFCFLTGMGEKVPLREVWGWGTVGVREDRDGERKLPEAGNGDRDGEHFRWRGMEWKSTPHSRPTPLTSLG